MSRMQQILEKAERDGSIRRFRNLTTDSPPTPLPDTPVMEPPIVARHHPVVDAAPPAALPSAAGRGRPVTGVTLDGRLVAATAPSSAQAEEFRQLRTRLMHAESSTALSVVMVTSPGRGDGKSLSAANLALTMAQDRQQRICLVDANLRHPELHRLMGLSDGAGLSDVLSGELPLTDALIDIEEQHLSFLAAGSRPEHPAELLGSPVMRRLIMTLRSAFDRIVIDAPSAVPLADVGILTPLVDAAVLVVRADVTSRPDIDAAIATIDEAKLVGIVLNGAHPW